TLMRINAEYLCKKLVGRPAAFAGPGVQGHPRSLGLIVDDWGAYGSGTGDELPPLVKQECGADMLVEHFSSNNNDESSYGTAIAHFRLAGVTTIAVDMDPIYFSPFLATSDSQGYYPEWYIPGTLVE